MKEVKIGLIGFGNVGAGVVKVLQDNSLLIEERAQAKINIKKIADIDIKRPRSVVVPPTLLTTDVAEIINDPEISIVVEAIPGADPARKFILDSIERGKHVVSSNKEVIAKHMAEILERARRKNVVVSFEGSVGGGIPIIVPLRECLAANRITEVYGIVNGTTNYILSKMTEGGYEFEEALDEAKKLGYAEADPRLDIEGYDASYKAAILASVAFHSEVPWDTLYFEGITKIKKEDIKYAKEIGYVIKLLAICKLFEGEIEVRVHPTLVPEHHPLAYVSDAYNAIYVKGDAVGEVMFYGQGAGGLPTASAVISDIIEIVRGRSWIPSKLEKLKLRNINDIKSRYYIRLKAPDRYGVLAGISGVFAEKKVSIQAVVQKETIADVATIVIILHEVQERSIREALKEIEKLPVVKEVCNVIRAGLK